MLLIEATASRSPGGADLSPSGFTHKPVAERDVFVQERVAHELELQARFEFVKRLLVGAQNLGELLLEVLLALGLRRLRLGPQRVVRMALFRAALVLGAGDLLGILGLEQAAALGEGHADRALVVRARIAVLEEQNAIEVVDGAVETHARPIRGAFGLEQVLFETEAQVA